MFRDEYNRKILCNGGCPLGDSAKDCKYCKSGACEADKPKTTTYSPELKALKSGEYVMYGGMLQRRN